MRNENKSPLIFSSFDNPALLQDIKRFVLENEDAIVRDIGRLVHIPSIAGPAEPDAPYGKEPKRALMCALEIGRELGLETVNCDNRIGYAAVGEDLGQGYLATITHVDVVPAGDGWPADAFTLRVQDGWLIGRGVMDDKGPSVLCLYALKYLKDRGVPLRYPVRALLGSNEESDMLDLAYYQEREPNPLFCFSPDADFPLIYGEKGIYHGRLISRHTPLNVLDISGGVAANAVPAGATARVLASRLESSDTVTATETEPGVWTLSASGVSGHASMPEGTVNAIGLLVDYLLSRDIPAEPERPYFELLAKLLRVTDGSLLGLDSSDDFFTPLTQNVLKIHGANRASTTQNTVADASGLELAMNHDDKGNAIIVDGLALVHRLACSDTATNLPHRKPEVLADDADSLGIQFFLVYEQTVCGCHCGLLELVELADATTRKALPIVAAMPCLKVLEVRCRIDYLTTVSEVREERGAEGMVTFNWPASVTRLAAREDALDVLWRPVPRTRESRKQAISLLLPEAVDTRPTPLAEATLPHVCLVFLARGRTIGNLCANRLDLLGAELPVLEGMLAQIEADSSLGDDRLGVTRMEALALRAVEEAAYGLTHGGLPCAQRLRQSARRTAPPRRQRPSPDQIRQDSLIQRHTGCSANRPRPA